ncbi:unnamed protein product [Pocillopora meandrina]|uniref:Uncharacterized protein n=1 Tax=Pocillopora meandrina TaxID=46732 RepID=A0AAU9XDW4_9CNID|nr:unnamed protein product [Pocillopora meandrina]
MATDDRQISAGPSANSSRLENEEHNVLPALRGTESNNNLRGGSLPFGIFSLNQVDTTNTAPRSFSVSGTRARDTPITLGLCRENKSAFEDLPVFLGKIGQNKENRQKAESAKNQKLIDSLRQLVTEPSSTKRLSKKEDERKDGSQNESNETLDTILKQTAHRQTEKEVADNSKEPEDNEDNASESRERLDIVESLLEFPFLPLQTDSRRKSSPGSLEPSSAPAHQTGASRQRHFSLGGVPQSPSTSGQSEALSAPRSSNEATRRRSSQSRRSSIAASLAGPGETKKGAMGLGTLAASLVKWKINSARKVIRTQETIAKDAKHQEFMDRAADRIKTELPRSLLISIQEEAYPIVLRTAQAYRSQLGAKHKLTVQASERLADLMRDLTNPY